MKEWLVIILSMALALLITVTCFASLCQALVDICRWVNYRTEVQQIRVEKERTELETMKAKLEKLKAEEA